MADPETAVDERVSPFVGPADVAVLLPDARGGGTERVRLLLIEEFIRLGIKVDLVLCCARGELLDEVPTSCRIVDLGASRMRHFPLRLRRYVVRYRPRTLLVALWPLTGIVCLVNRTLWRRPRLVVTEHNDFRRMPSLTALEKWGLRYFGRWLYSLADAVGAVSHGVARSMSGATGFPLANINVVYNPIRKIIPVAIDPDDSDIATWWHDGGRRIVAVGSLKPQKGFGVLLTAFARIAEPLDAKLLVLGEGQLRAPLAEKIAQLGLEDRVKMPGFRVNPFPFMQQADLLVLSSFWEGLPGVLIEALACGTPVVATDCPSGPAEILQDGAYGMLVPVGNEYALAEGIRRTLEAPPEESRLRQRAQAFTQDAAAGEYLALLGLD